MNKYVIPKGWNSIDQPYHGVSAVNILMSNGEIVSDRCDWEAWQRYSKQCLSGFDLSIAFPVAWQFVEPLEIIAEPVYEIGPLPEWVTLDQLCTVRYAADKTIACFSFQGSVADSTKAIFERMHAMILNGRNSQKGNK